MVEFNMDLSELNQLAADLGKVDRVGVKAASVVRKTASAIERDAKLFAPVDTGNLRNSISTDVEGDGRFGSMTAVIGPTANYGHFVEFGTTRMAPSAYMGPALDRHSSEFAQAIEQLGGDLL